MSEQVIKVMPAQCRNRGCKRPVRAREVAAYAKDRALSHELVNPDWCLKCNANYLQDMRASRPAEGIMLDMGDYFDEDRTVWPRGSY